MAEDNVKKAQPEKLTFWTPDHRIVFTNSFSIRMGDNDITIECSTEQNVNGTDGYLSSTQLVMTPKSAKVLALLLTKSLERMERELGPIPLDPERANKIAEMIESAQTKKS